MKLGIDIMGGDFCPTAPIEGAIAARSELQPNTEIVLFGPDELIRQELAARSVNPDLFSIVHCADVIEMGEHPAAAFRHKPHSTIAVGIQMVKAKQLDCFISAGNTGAMLVGSHLILGNIAGI
ncbi:MAG: phosphate--acyl-ACP acyltransferase, partial [Bacteroidia bacterium]|nr:phosphate--acyl-ACP acyltransferase [Bacteroidia bacterium]